MTPHERLFAAIERNPVDRLPFYTYNCHPFTDSPHVKEPGYRPILDKILNTSAGCLCKVSARAHREMELETHSEARQEGENVFTTVTWETPAGPLTRVTRKPAGQPGLCVKHFVEDAADIERFRSVPYAFPKWDVTPVVDRISEIGPKGVAYVDYGDPFYRISDLFDQEDFAIRTLTDIEELKSLVDFQFDRTFEDLKQLLEALSAHDVKLIFYTVGPERATPPLLSPAIFERLVVPYQSRLVSLIHDHGHPASLHCHGRVREILPHAITCRFDLIEPLEPPPQGNIDLAALKHEAGGNLALLGYIQDQDFYTLEEEEIRARVREIARTAGSDSGYVCCPTCTPFQYPPSEHYVTNYIAFLDEADKEG